MFINLKNHLFLFCVALVFVLCFIQAIFFGIQSLRAKDTSKVIESILRNEFSEGNPYYLSNSIKDLENLGVIDCSILVNVARKIEYSNLRSGKKCSSTPLLLDGIYSRNVYTTLGGEKWRLDYRVQNTHDFFIFLWITRIIVFFFIVIIYKFYIEKLIKNSLVIQLENASYKEKQKYVELANQVSHDIKSPLAALEMVMDDIRDLPEESRELTLHAINRIQEIANNLSNENDSKTEKAQECSALISYTLMATIKEKLLEFQNKPKLKIHFTDHTNHMNFISISSLEISRVISNLVNNAAQALKYTGSILIDLNHVGDTLELIVRDTGTGFPDSMLNSSIKRGNTIGKEDGQGLGLYHAYETIVNTNGEFKIYNDGGAVVEMRIPQASIPSWFLGPIEFNRYSKIYIIDDDKSIHDLWNRVLKSKKIISDIIHLQSKDEIEIGIISISESDLVLIDHDLRLSKTGIDLICKFNLKNVVLVTSGYDRDEIQKFCTERKIGLLPKYLVSYI